MQEEENLVLEIRASAHKQEPFGISRKRKGNTKYTN